MGHREYIKGDKVGDNGIVFQEEIDPKIYFKKKGPQKQRMGIFLCFCGNLFKTTIDHVVGNHTKSCGCTRKLNFNTKTHGKTKHRLYPIWNAMRERCLNENDPSFKNYGARGIDVFPIWDSDFQSFFDYVTALPNYNKKGYTLDRINNDKGYFPGNLRWTTRHIQAVNTRKNASNITGYEGIFPNKMKWIATIGVNGEHIYLGSYPSKVAAVEARDKYIIKNNLAEYKLQSLIIK